MPKTSPHFRSAVLVGLTVLCIAMSLPAVADTTMNAFVPQASYMMTAGEPIKYLVRSFFYIILMVAVFLLVKKYFLPQGLTLDDAGRFRVVRKLPLEMNVALYLVQAGAQYLLIGVGAKQLTLVKELTEEQAKPLLAAPQVTSPFSGTFKSHLDALMQKVKR